MLLLCWCVCDGHVIAVPNGLLCVKHVRESRLEKNMGEAPEGLRVMRENLAGAREGDVALWGRRLWREMRVLEGRWWAGRQGGRILEQGSVCCRMEQSDSWRSTM